jgi:hypothetical protein
MKILEEMNNRVKEIKLFYEYDAPKFRNIVIFLTAFESKLEYLDTFTLTFSSITNDSKKFNSSITVNKFTNNEEALNIIFYDLQHLLNNPEYRSLNRFVRSEINSNAMINSIELFADKDVIEKADEIIKKHSNIPTDILISEIFFLKEEIKELKGKLRNL